MHTPLTKASRRLAIDALSREDRAFVLGYLASSVPGAVDLALHALARTRAEELFDTSSGWNDH
jgi:hypothetical protein